MTRTLDLRQFTAWCRAAAAAGADGAEGPGPGTAAGGG
jgi:hypothetical protein